MSNICNHQLNTIYDTNITEIVYYRVVSEDIVPKLSRRCVEVKHFRYYKCEVTLSLCNSIESVMKQD